jgi:hypothetical protein
MARGWESKSVEAQIETSVGPDQEPGKHRTAQADAALQRQGDGLRLARIRVLHDLEAARHPRHRAILQAALDHLDRELDRLSKELDR